MADQQPYPDWDKSASRGDLVRSLAYLSTAISSLGVAAAAMQRGEQEKANEALQGFLKEASDISRLIDELGGRQHGD